MERDAVVSPHTLGALEAYRQVIIDISEVLRDPVIDIGKLFYAVMIQSGVKRFRVPEEYISRLPGLSLLSNRVESISYSTVEPTLRGLHDRIFSHLRRSSLSEAEQRLVNELVLFLQDLYVAAEFRRPVVTVLEVPDVSQLRPLLKEDMYLVVEALLSARTILRAPVQNLYFVRFLRPVNLPLRTLIFAQPFLLVCLWQVGRTRFREREDGEAPHLRISRARCGGASRLPLHQAKEV
jgi:hypothetical protein